MDKQWLIYQTAISGGLVVFLFFAIRYLIEQKVKDMSKMKEDVEKDKDLWIDTHTLICDKTQAEFKLHVSDELNKTKDEIMKEIRNNKEAVTALIVRLRGDLKNNGALK